MRSFTSAMARLICFKLIACECPSSNSATCDCYLGLKAATPVDEVSSATAAAKQIAMALLLMNANMA